MAIAKHKKHNRSNKQWLKKINNMRAKRKYKESPKREIERLNRRRTEEI